MNFYAGGLLDKTLVKLEVILQENIQCEFFQEE